MIHHVRVYNLILLVLMLAAPRAQSQEGERGDTSSAGLRRSSGLVLPRHGGLIDVGAGVGASLFDSSSQRLLLFAECTYSVGGAFVAARYTRNLEPEPRTQFLRYEPRRTADGEHLTEQFDLLAGIEREIPLVPSLRVRLGAGLGTAGFLQTWHPATIAGTPQPEEKADYSRPLTVLGLVVGIQEDMPITRQLSLSADMRANFNFFKPVYSVSLGARYALWKGPHRAEPDSPAAGQPARNILYGELTTTLLTTSVSINYERVLAEHFTLRTGIGIGYRAFIDDAILTGTGALAMLNFVSDMESGLELGAGASVIQGDRTRALSGEWWRKRDVQSLFVKPSFALGFRYQPREEGFFFRTGFSWVYFYGAGIHLGLGQAF